MLYVKSLLFFLLAGMCEIGGGYLVWLWLREGKNAWLAVLGSMILILYGVIPTLQPANFGRVYAAYGGVFIVLSLLWAWYFDKTAPDRCDLIGGHHRSTRRWGHHVLATRITHRGQGADFPAPDRDAPLTARTLEQR